ncbi:c-type cytochrome biogenesis protein CcmI [Nevskia soli]|uniref:c-type cytochrome biogenesis protein CcmI n=1 Tax=Nevskia soli TaxID=418856 RepID=UPI0004A6F076|nr:c-type cytochrome biogenesis protein CcmI [Nevskia soli]
MTQWFLMAALLLAAAAVMTRPWWRGANRKTLRRRGANIAAYRSRLDELEIEREAGLVSADDVAALKTELDARLLSEAQVEDQAMQAGSGRGWLPALLTSLLLLLFAGGWYIMGGSWKAEQQLAAGATQQEQVAGMVQMLADRLQKQPDDPEGWAMLGRSYFVTQHFDAAAKAYGEANARAAAPNPEWLAGQGEALAFARDRDLLGTPLELFQRALAVDPDYGKALWYAGMAAAQAGDTATARARWSKLLAQTDLPPQMHDVIQTRLQELDGQPPAGAGPMAAAAGAPAAGGPAGQSGAPAGAPVAAGPALMFHVSLAPEVAAKVPPGAVLFVFAKAEQGPPMPLAVQRLPGQTLPADIKLDDSMAMAPALRLSAFDRYIVTARLSGGGGAQAQSGDLEGILHVQRAQAGQPLDLRIDHVVP